MDSEPPIIPRTPPNCSQLSNSVPLESVDPALQSEWNTHSATGVACEVILTSLYPLTRNGKPSETLRLSLEEALSMWPEVARYKTVASICNVILHEYYKSNPPTEDHPARWFIPLGTSISDRNFAQRSPDMVVVVRHLWEEHIRLQLEKEPISQKKDSKEWKKVFPDWESVDGGITDLLTNTSTLKADDLDPNLLCALAIHPPWECILAMVEFNDSNTLHSTASTSTPVASNSTNTAESEQEATSGSNGSITPVKSSKETLGSSPVAKHDTTLLASIDAKSPQHSSANDPSAPSPTPRKTSSPEVQLLSYFCEIMSAARYRDWTSGAIISDMDFSLVTCDREGAIKSAPTSLGTADGVDIFSRWVLAVGSGPLAKSGFSNIFGSTAGGIDGVDFGIPDNAKRDSEGAIRLKFGKRHYQEYGAFGRGTALYCVDITKGDETIPGVCKISWPAASRDSEYDLIQQARTVDPNHLPEVIFSWDIEASDLPSRALRSRCPQAALKYEPKVLRIVAFPFYAPIYELEGDEFLTAFWDVMLCNVKLYEANVVHRRDPSVNNMMYRRDEDGHVIGVLSDFDLAVSIPSGEPSSVHHSGTPPFMALDLLKPNACKRELEHDFESALYIMLWIALGYKGWKPPMTGDPLSDWRHGTWSQIYTAKTAFINTDFVENEKDFLGLITPQYQVLCSKISELHLEIAWRVQIKMQERGARRYGKERPAIGPMTPEMFFDIIGPPPLGREAYSQN